MLTDETPLPEGEWSILGLSPRQYENLALNQAETLRWVTEAKARLDYYRGEADAPKSSGE